MASVRMEEYVTGRINAFADLNIKEHFVNKVCCSHLDQRFLNFLTPYPPCPICELSRPLRGYTYTTKLGEHTIF